MINKLLVNRNFALLWTGQTISVIGDNVFLTTVLLWVAVQIAGGQSWAPLAVSGVLLAMAIPEILLAAVAGAYVDRWDKRLTIVVCNVVLAALMGLLLIDTGEFAFTTTVRLGFIYLVVVLSTVLVQFAVPARMALIGDIVAEGERQRASGLNQMGYALGTIIGPPIGAPLLFVFGVQWALVLNGMSFLAAAATAYLIRAPEAARSTVAGEKAAIGHELAEGLRFYFHNRVLMTLLISAVILLLGAGALNSLDVFFVIQNLHTAPRLYGWLGTAFGVGAVVGGIGAAVFANKLSPARILYLCLFASGVGLLIYSRLTNFTAALILLFIVGIPVSGLNIAIMPLVLSVTPRELVGRVVGVLHPAISLSSVVSMSLAGLLVSTVLRRFHATVLGMNFGPVDTVFVGAGLMCLVAGVYAVRGLRGYQAQNPPAESQPELEPVTVA